MPTDPLAPHLSDATLNEYLDAALSPAAAAAAETHLGACAGCAARLAGLRALFESLEALPETSLHRDLVPGVLSTLPRPPKPAARRRVWLPWALGAQALGAALAFWLAWPFLAGWAGRLRLADGTSLFGAALAAVEPWLAVLDTERWRVGGQAAAEALRSGWQAVWPLMPGALSPQSLLAAVAGVGLVWIVTNGWLLHNRPGRRRRSP